MELGMIFLIWLAVTILDNMGKRKKRRLPPPQNQSPDFDIPTLGNDPNFPGEEVPIFIESPRPAEVQPLNPPPRPANTPPRRPAQVRETDDAKELDLNLTPSKVLNAFVMSEILDKPKALRKRPFVR